MWRVRAADRRLPHAPLQPWPLSSRSRRSTLGERAGHPRARFSEFTSRLPGCFGALTLWVTTGGGRGTCAAREWVVASLRDVPRERIAPRHSRQSSALLEHGRPVDSRRSRRSSRPSYGIAVLRARGPGEECRGLPVFVILGLSLVFWGLSRTRELIPERSFG
jgi:hypothetical protein